jgi:hypothetical protein
MKIKVAGFVVAATMSLPVVANAQYVYTYTGPDFNSITQAGSPGGPNPYTTADDLTIQLVTSQPLAANMGIPTPGAPQLQGVDLVSMIVSDGVQTAHYTAANIANSATLPFTTSIDGYITTNSKGMITSSAISGQTDANNHQFFWVNGDIPKTSYSTPGDTAIDGIPMGAYFSASSSGFGKWTLAVAPEIDPASAATGVALLLCGLAMRMGARRARSRGSITA